MYKPDEANRVQFQKERNTVIIFTAFLALLVLFIYFSYNYDGFSPLYYVIYVSLFALIVYISSVYVFFKKRRSLGTVTEIKNFKNTHYRGMGGSGQAYTSWAEIIEVTVNVRFDNGKEKEFVFVYKGDVKILKVGDRIGIYRFLKMPVWA